MKVMGRRGLCDGWRVLLAASVLLVTVAGQRTEDCDVQKSPLFEDKVDVHCNCMQRLAKMNRSIDKLTINQTGCSETGLQLKWHVLETQVKPKTLVLGGAQVFFGENPSRRPWKSSITNLSFVDCLFASLPSHAFGGLDLLEEVKILGGSVGAIEADAFGGHRSLRVVEIANATLRVIEGRAFNDLPSLEDLAIVNSAVDSIESEAVFLLRRSDEGVRRCTLADGSSSSSSFPGNRTSLHDMMLGRHLSSTGDLPLPGYGSRLLLFRNDVRVLQTRAVTAETLGFLIVGGNRIEEVRSRAFSMELHNECEISAAIFIGNKITSLGNSALEGLRGRDGISYQTFIALSYNTFLTVSKDGFLLPDSMEIFSIGQNKFQCACDRFDWILGNADSQTQRDLEKEIVREAVCLDGSNLISFTSSCTDHGTTTTDLPTTPTRPTAHPTVQTAQTARPTVQTARPTTQTARPTAQTARPTTQTARPTAQTPKPRPSSAPTQSISIVGVTVGVLAVVKVLV